jgi:hypothetical protein
MRVFEVVPYVNEGRRVFDATEGRLDGLRLGEVPTGTASDAAPGDLVVLAVDEMGILGSTLSGLATGVWAVVFLPTTVFEIPVGSVVDALQASGLQAVDAIPVDDRTCGVAIVVANETGWAPIRPYLAGRTGVVPTEPALRRIVAEQVIGGLAARARRSEDPEAQALRERVTELEGQLAASQKRLNGILNSRAYGLAKKIAALKP